MTYLFFHLKAILLKINKFLVLFQNVLLYKNFKINIIATNKIEFLKKTNLLFLETYLKKILINYKKNYLKKQKTFFSKIKNKYFQ